MQNRSQQDCSSCIHRNRQIFIVGSERFNVEVFSHFINDHTPACCKIIPRLRDIPPFKESENPNWRMIFIDCHGFDSCSILKILQSEAAHLLGNDVLALFNLQRDAVCHLELLALGIRGFFYQDDAAGILLKGICALNKGEIWVSRETMMDYISSRTVPSCSESHTSKLLTQRERDVLALVAIGTSNEEIASRLFISQHTVKTHMYNIFRKIDVPNRLQAALWAAKHLF